MRYLQSFDVTLPPSCVFNSCDWTISAHRRNSYQFISFQATQIGQGEGSLIRSVNNCFETLVCGFNLHNIPASYKTQTRLIKGAWMSNLILCLTRFVRKALGARTWLKLQQLWKLIFSLSLSETASWLRTSLKQVVRLKFRNNSEFMPILLAITANFYLQLGSLYFRQW